MAKLTNVEFGVAYEVPVDTAWSKEQRAWLAGTQRFSDETGEEYVFEPDTVVVIPPTLGVIAFKRMFTIDERLKAKELRATNPRVDDFWSQLDDPRTDVVVMALPSVQEDIEYTLQAIKNSGLDIDVAARKAKVLIGEVQ